VPVYERREYEIELLSKGGASPPSFTTAPASHPNQAFWLDNLVVFHYQNQVRSRVYELVDVFEVNWTSAAYESGDVVTVKDFLVLIRIQGI
jgi:hypothetical protein